MKKIVEWQNSRTNIRLRMLQEKRDYEIQMEPSETQAALAVIDAAMKEDNELTATQLQSKLAANGIYMSLDQNDPVIDEAILTREWSWQS